MSASLPPAAIAAATIQAAMFPPHWLEELRRDPSPVRRRGRQTSARASQLALFTERAVAGKLVFAFVVKRHFERRGRALRPLPKTLPTREEMRAIHELLVSVYCDDARVQTSCAEWEAVAMFQALEAE